MRTFALSLSQLETCPIARFDASHWREDGTCQCRPSAHELLQADRALAPRRRIEPGLLERAALLIRRIDELLQVGPHGQAGGAVMYLLGFVAGLFFILGLWWSPIVGGWFRLLLVLGLLAFLGFAAWVSANIEKRYPTDEEYERWRQRPFRGG